MSALRFALAALAALLATRADAALDLANATRHELDNGLTVLLLEDRSFPLVSVQMLYRVGARHELPGKTGLAHFVEHSACRGSERFPGTGLTDAIYAVGGEWHGYTWIDQTTYFATAPAAELGLLLDIEAERMAKLEILERDVEAEKGAVLAEMQGYENDPAAVLFDATLYASLVAHPYRNNTIGFASDIRGITHGDVTAFWRRYYRPANAVLAIVGDIDTAAVLGEVERRFGELPGADSTTDQQVVEPPQQGERRVRVRLPASRQHFQIAWHAPAADDAAFPAFLLLQELLGGSGGVNFLQNEFGTAVRAGSRLAGISDDLATWIIPTADPYVFLVKGSIAEDADPHALEDAVQRAIASLGNLPTAEVERARERLLDRLVLDLQTTEDAAHQLAYYEGIDALDALLDLPARIRALEAGDVSQVARERLRPELRTVGWLVDGRVAEPASRPAPGAVPREAPLAPSREPAPPAATGRLSNGIPVLIQRSELSPTAHLLVALPGGYRDDAGRLARGLPVLGTTAFSETTAAADFDGLVARALAAVTDARPAGPAPEPASFDPYTRFEEIVARIAVEQDPPDVARPALIAVAGDVASDAAMARLEAAFGSLPAVNRDATPGPAWATAGAIDAHIPRRLAQARVGYAVPAPPPDDPAADAWRALLYILSHDYGGRLGNAAISERGLVYYIDARYRSDGERALVTLSAGVDPEKLAAMRKLLIAEIARLTSEPPSPEEVAEALRWRVGRARSAAQSNAELAASLATDRLWYGELLSADELEARLVRVSRADVLAAIDAFAAGSVVTITVDAN